MRTSLPGPQPGRNLSRARHLLIGLIGGIAAEARPGTGSRPT